MTGAFSGFHDYKLLVREWRDLCRLEDLNFKFLLQHDGFPIIEIKSRASHKNRLGWIYLSAGIHGDEPAGPRGLLEWAKRWLSEHSPVGFVIYPCMNPWGFLNNSREDASGMDLNRVWDQPSHPLVEFISSSIRDLSISLSLNLHEDYDADGIYLYEPFRGGRADKYADSILRAAEGVLSRDSRFMIDGRRVRNGIIRPRTIHKSNQGMPEALYLFNRFKSRNFTIETPSEFDYRARVGAQERMIQEAISLYSKANF